MNAHQNYARSPAGPADAATHDVVAPAAVRLLHADDSGTPCKPVRDLIGDGAASAYAVQRAGMARRVEAGARIVGRKVGLTSPAVQAQ